MKKFFRIFLLVLLLAAFVGTLVFLYINSKPKVDVYDIVEPSIGSIERSTVLTGKIEPRDEIDIKPQISGIITEINVEPGDVVHSGDVIARIKVIPEASSLSSAQSRVETARISLNDAETKFNRTKALYEKKIVSREEFETAQTKYDQSQRELEAAEDSYNIVREGVSRYNATESNTLVRATTDGLVLDVPVKVGSSVIQANTFNDGTTVATIADMTDLIFKGNVDETEVGNLSQGMEMKISVGALPDISARAVIEYIAPKGKEENGANTFEIKGTLQLDSVSSTLRAGYSANATVTLYRADSVLTVPESVIEYVGDSTYVYVLTDTVPAQQFERRAFAGGKSDGIKMEVKQGVSADDRLRGALQKK